MKAPDNYFNDQLQNSMCPFWNKDLLEFLSGFLGGSCVAPVMPGVGTHLSGGKVLLVVKVEGLALHHYSTYFEFILLWTNCVFF